MKDWNEVNGYREFQGMRALSGKCGASHPPRAGWVTHWACCSPASGQTLQLGTSLVHHPPHFGVGVAEVIEKSHPMIFRSIDVIELRVDQRQSPVSDGMGQSPKDLVIVTESPILRDQLEVCSGRI